MSYGRRRERAAKQRCMHASSCKRAAVWKAQPLGAWLRQQNKFILWSTSASMVRCLVSLFWTCAVVQHASIRCVYCILAKFASPHGQSPTTCLTARSTTCFTDCTEAVRDLFNCMHFCLGSSLILNCIACVQMCGSSTRCSNSSHRRCCTPRQGLRHCCLCPSPNKHARPRLLRACSIGDLRKTVSSPTAPFIAVVRS
jgi:hypothetical protein